MGMHFSVVGTTTPTLGGAGGARIVLQTELFPSLLSFERAFSGALDSLVLENFSDPHFGLV